jgi:hypothetical protein
MVTEKPVNGCKFCNRGGVIFYYPGIRTSYMIPVNKAIAGWKRYDEEKWVKHV